MRTLDEGPLAYLITFHTYGTWLQGDPRGAATSEHRIYGAPYAGASPGRHASHVARLRHPPVLLGPEARTTVLRTIEELCRHRGWRLWAAHVRTNHVHVVITAEHAPERVMADVKAWTTRRTAEAGLHVRGATLWVRHGSTRYLWRREHVDAACAYVLEGQGGGTRWTAGGGTAA